MRKRNEFNFKYFKTKRKKYWIIEDYLKYFFVSIF